MPGIVGDAVQVWTLPEGRRLKRAELDSKTHAIDASGRVLRDNVWGSQAEDAERRDFTINAMYYDPAAQTVHDYHHGMEDIRARLLRMIGDPATRYREDPVRMLRVVRFAAKTGFDIDEATRHPVAGLAELIHNVPSARLFDEMLKLLMSGHAWASLQELRKAGLHKGLLPLLDVALEQPMGQRFVQLALDNTDRRVQAGKPVSPGFLFAALPGTRAHGRDFIPEALSRGAAAVLADPGTLLPGPGAVLVADDNPRRRLSLMAAAFYRAQPRVIGFGAGDELSKLDRVQRR